jgi:catechol 2,3-dioxygenase-like lactoylglutathione lyase family enzyme
MSEQSTTPDVVSLRPFVPARDFATSLRFYAELGFATREMDAGLAAVQLGPFGFLLQQYDVEAFAGHFMMHVVVKDLDAWWARIEALDLATNYGVRAPTAPKLQPWGLVVTYVVDPSGVLWHFAQERTVGA